MTKHDRAIIIESTIRDAVGRKCGIVCERGGACGAADADAIERDPISQVKTAVVYIGQSVSDWDTKEFLDKWSGRIDLENESDFDEFVKELTVLLS